MTSTIYAKPRTTWHAMLIRGPRVPRVFRLKQSWGESETPVRQMKDVIATVEGQDGPGKPDPRESEEDSDNLEHDCFCLFASFRAGVR